MGSFALTCTVSGLPIEAGDPVYFFMLTQSPSESGPFCYITDLWFPRVWPLRAHYNDYGSVKDFKDSPKLRKLWMDTFEVDLVQRGWGDNSCHDTATHKGMPFEQMLEALWEQRILVEQESFKLDAEVRNSPVPDGVPTIDRIEAVLLASEFQRYIGEHNSSTILVDEIRNGEIRVRIGVYSDNVKQLEKAESLIRQGGYAVMLSHGTGSYAADGELLVRPLPSTKGYHGGVGPLNLEKPLPVRQAMIREDVWKALCALPLKPDYSKSVTVEEFRGAAREAWAAVTKVLSKKDSALSQELQELLFTTGMGLGLEGIARLFLTDPVPFTVGLGKAFKVASQQELSPKEKKTFLDTAGEFVFLQHLLSSIRYQWKPSYPNGPQGGEWKMHKTVLNALRGVVVNAIKERR